MRIKSSDDYPLRRGSVIAFGALDERWELVDDSAPSVMAIPLQGGNPVLLDGDLLALPSGDDPRATIYRTSDGSWVLEQPNESVTPITNLQTFEVDGQGWRFCCVEDVRTTSLAANPMDMEVRHLQLSFFVSRERIVMTASWKSARPLHVVSSHRNPAVQITTARPQPGCRRQGLDRLPSAGEDPQVLPEQSEAGRKGPGAGSPAPRQQTHVQR